MKNVREALKEAIKSDDFTQSSITINMNTLYLSYYKSIINHEQLHHDVLDFIQRSPTAFQDVLDIKRIIPIDDVQLSSKLEEISLHLTKGALFIQIDSNPNEGILINIADTTKGYRKSNLSEDEYSVIGPKVAFVEDIDTNLNLLRKEIITENLIFEELTKGSLSKSRVVIAYIDGITNPQHVNTLRQRLMDVDVDVVFDTAILDQIISDNSNTPFPLFTSTERVDRMKFNLLSGQVGVLSSGSPFAISGPATVFEFFFSPEDYYLPWILGTFFRIIRFIGVIFTIFATPIYVSIITFHYSIVPKNLLGPIIESRSNVPFPPFLEVLIMEITVELLREAGARLPTKVGQTLGIVGGIVLGQAAVSAGLTSNILIIIVALSALATFTTPIFKMANTIRFLRFPMIILAGVYGGFGVMVGTVFLLAHLLRLKSLGTPYMVPLYPFRYKDFKDGFVRSALSMTWSRPGFLRPLILRRYQVKKHKDIKNDFNDE